MGKGKGHIPIRTCISCGSKYAKNELIRLLLDKEDRLVKDISGKSPGRGVYICKTRSCREQLSKNRRLNRLFRTEKVITISPELIF
ncbi:YlxR family protein [Thermodesulfobacteriota bacterium]